MPSSMLRQEVLRAIRLKHPDAPAEVDFPPFPSNINDFSASENDVAKVERKKVVRMEVASSRPDHLPTLSIAKTSGISSNRLFWWRSGRCRHCCSDFCFSVPAITKLTLYWKMPELFFQCKIYTWLCAQVLKPCALPVCTSP